MDTKEKIEEADLRELIGEYHITYLLRDEDAGSVISVLKRFQAEIVEEKSPVKVNLEYPIKKQRQAFLGVTRFFARKEVIAKLSQDLNLESSVLRFLITKPILTPAASPESGEAKSLGQLKQAGSARADRGSNGGGDEFGARKRRASGDDFPVLTNEALEKKIEEILQ